ncbi:DUF6624 domain-containing protein [Acrocarpospora catenulata]|uniref:DUF6624 domain-containing protein n=1 Tax=Acrocarpospora catenulata TaxID=2836182 RepID=UPI001BDB08BD|nr:DUF6624 domain-containing protein [Acrocarpospora catenulata]
MTDDELVAELLRRMKVDQEIRQPIENPPSREHMSRWVEIDRDNTAWLLSVVRDRGWPLLSQVGERGELAAWLLAQHADASPEVQREFHALLTEAVANGEAKPSHLAYLEDRVRVNSGRPQLYGTQFIEDGDGLRPRPIEDPDQLDERRAAVGLEPFEEYAARMRQLAEGDT